MRLLLTAILLLSNTAAAASPALERAKAEDAALRKNEAKLRLRHNITNVIQLWRQAEEGAEARVERMEAVRGQAEAWSLLARWSGRSDDAARAEKERQRLAALEPKILRGAAVELEGSSLALRFDAAGPYDIARGTYGDKRIYFDLSPVIAAKEVLGDLRIETPAIERARVGQLDGDTVRVVLDFTGAVADQVRDVDIGRGRITMALEGAEDPSSVLSEIVAELKAAYPDVTEEPRNETPLKKSTREAARARRQSLLAIRKVVIDAGHGGKDTGAIGRDRVTEKDVNLAIALKLGKELEKLGMNVVYTRTSDKFVSLEKRTAIANRSNGDLFISVHANANHSRRIHGIETYYLNTSSSRYSLRLARRENGQGDAPDVDPTEEEADAGELPDGALGADLRLLLADLAMRSATTESKRLAGYVQSSMIRTLRREHADVKDLGVKHALFAVLLGVRMPSVLIETGFVTHPNESRRLASTAYQAQVAKAIAKGVERFVEERQQLAVNVRQPP